MISRVANSGTICDASVRSASSERDPRRVREEHDNRQSETQLRPPIMHTHRSHTHRDSLPNHRGKEDIRQASNPLQHEFPAGARLLQVVQSISQDLCRLPSVQRLSFQFPERGPLFLRGPCSLLERPLGCTQVGTSLFANDKYSVANLVFKFDAREDQKFRENEH